MQDGGNRKGVERETDTTSRYQAASRMLLPVDVLHHKLHRLRQHERHELHERLGPPAARRGAAFHNSPRLACIWIAAQRTRCAAAAPQGHAHGGGARRSAAPGRAFSVLWRRLARGRRPIGSRAPLALHVRAKGRRAAAPGPPLRLQGAYPISHRCDSSSLVARRGIWFSMRTSSGSSASSFCPSPS